MKTLLSKFGVYFPRKNLYKYNTDALDPEKKKLTKEEEQHQKDLYSKGYNKPDDMDMVYGGGNQNNTSKKRSSGDSDCSSSQAPKRKLIVFKPVVKK